MIATESDGPIELIRAMNASVLLEPPVAATTPSAVETNKLLVLVGGLGASVAFQSRLGTVDFVVMEQTQLSVEHFVAELAVKFLLG